MTNRVVEPGITLDIALLVKSQMTAIVQGQARSNNKFISFQNGSIFMILLNVLFDLAHMAIILDLNFLVTPLFRA